MNWKNAKVIQKVIAVLLELLHDLCLLSANKAENTGDVRIILMEILGVPQQFAGGVASELKIFGFIRDCYALPILFLSLSLKA